MTEDLVAFLRTRYDETAAKARAAASMPGGGHWVAADNDDHPMTVAGRQRDGRGLLDIVEPNDNETCIHIACHDPAHVLADIDAKRRAVTHLVKQIENAEVWWLDSVLTPILRLLALPYADHPDYRPEWRPQGEPPQTEP